MDTKTIDNIKVLANNIKTECINLQLKVNVLDRAEFLTRIKVIKESAEAILNIE